jgi:hypothetical protein
MLSIAFLRREASRAAFRALHRRLRRLPPRCGRFVGFALCRRLVPA